MSFEGVVSNGSLQRIQLQVPTGISTELDEAIVLGIKLPLDSPINVFFLEDNITHEDPYVYFFVYSLGKRRIIGWGVYHRDDGKFYWNGQCRYKVSEISKAVRYWKENGFKYQGNTVENKALSRIKYYSGEDVWSYDDYMLHKYLLGMITGKIEEEAVTRRFPEIPDLYSRMLDKEYFQLRESRDYTSEEEAYEDAINNIIVKVTKEISDYENNMNRTDYVTLPDVRNLSPQEFADVFAKTELDVINEIQRLTSEFFRQMNFAQRYDLFTDKYAELPECPPLSQCEVEEEIYGSSSELCNAYFYGSRKYYERDPRGII